MSLSRCVVLFYRESLIIYRVGEPTPANPDAPAQPVLEKKSGIPMLGYGGEVIDFTDTRIVIWSGWENARYYVRPSDVVLIGKEKEARTPLD